MSDTDVIPAPDQSEPSPAADEGGQLGWLAQLHRVAGLLLVPLAATVFAYTYLLDDVGDLRALDVEQRWSNPALQLTDWAFVAVALLHGAIGWHWFLGRHVSAPPLRLAVEGGTLAVVAVAFVYGSLAILSV